MDADKTLGVIRTMVRAWEEAPTPDAEHAAARELSSAIGAMDDWLTNGGTPPADWMSHQSLRVLEMLREFLQELSRAMDAENITGVYKARILNRLAYGGPNGLADLDEQMAAGAEQEAPGVGLWHVLNETPIGPGPEVPIFGSNFREVSPETVAEDCFPLTSTCVCGEEIRFELGGSWQHSRPSV